MKKFTDKVGRKYGSDIVDKMGLLKKSLSDLLRSRNYNATIDNYNAIYKKNPNRLYRNDSMKEQVKELIPYLPNDANIFDGGCGNGWGSLYLAGLLPHIAAVDVVRQGEESDIVPVDGLKQGDYLLQEQLKESHIMAVDITKKGLEGTAGVLKGHGNQFHVVAVDVAQEGLDILNKEVETIGLTDCIETKNISISRYLEDLNKQYPLSNQKFDLMMCMNSLQYEKKLAPVIENMQKNTNKGGYHVISIPLFDNIDESRKGTTVNEIKSLYPEESYHIVHEREFNSRNEAHRPWLDIIFKKL